MIGVVLCGGHSTRMHRDKGLMQSGKDTWAQRMIDLLLQVCDTVIVSINEEQASYREKLSGCSFVSDDENLGLHGPLQGVFSVHAAYPQEDLLVLACDMQQMLAEVPAFLKELYTTVGTVEAIVFKEPDESAEPLCGIYAAAGLKRMYAYHQQQGLPRYSMKYLLEQLNAHYESIPEKWLYCFANYNTPEDISPS